MECRVEPPYHCIVPITQSDKAMLPYLSTSNAKTDKSVSVGYLTAILHLAPSQSGKVGKYDFDGGGYVDVCPYATDGCIAACLGRTAGRMRFDSVHKAQRRRTRDLWHHTPIFLRLLSDEIAAHARKADRLGLLPAVRLNGTSDLNWRAERFLIGGKSLMEIHRNVRFYDYTKNPKSARESAIERLRVWGGDLDGPHYHRTYSVSERDRADNLATAQDILRCGGNVAIVFRDRIPGIANLNGQGFPVVSGDSHDCTFLHREGYVIGLMAKGKEAKTDTSGFVFNAAELEL